MVATKKSTCYFNSFFTFCNPLNVSINKWKLSMLLTVIDQARFHLSRYRGKKQSLTNSVFSVLPEFILIIFITSELSGAASCAVSAGVIGYTISLLTCFNYYLVSLKCRKKASPEHFLQERKSQKNSKSTLPPKNHQNLLSSLA